MIRTYLIAALAAISFIACSNSKDEPDEPKTDTTITVSESAIEIDSEAQTVKFTVTSTANWNISTTADWCKLFPSGGIKNQATEVTATVTANTAMEARTATVTITGGGKSQDVTIRQNPKSQVSLSVTSLSAGAQRSEISFTVTSNTSYNISSSAAWLSLGDTKGDAGEKTFKATVDENTGNASREATITVAYGNESQTIKVTQLSDFVNTPDGYTLVWSDEFNDPKYDMPDESLWWYEVWAPGFVNNELQRYVAGKRGDKKTAEISNGILKIHAIKDGNEVISARVNTKESWTYGYFEARLKLPKGKGTWPAFWMDAQTGQRMARMRRDRHHGRSRLSSQLHIVIDTLRGLQSRHGHTAHSRSVYSRSRRRVPRLRPRVDRRLYQNVCRRQTAAQLHQ